MIALRLTRSDLLDPVPALHRMPPAEAARFVRKCADALRSHASDVRLGWDKENALAAFATVVAILLEVRELYPAEHAHIDDLLRRHGHSVAEH